MQLNARIKDFIESNIDLFESLNYSAIYTKAEYQDLRKISQLHEIWKHLEVDPLKELTYIPFCYFGSNTHNEIELPKNIDRIQQFAFYDCEINKLTLPIQIEMIESNAFRYAVIHELVMNCPLTDMSENAFAYAEIDVLKFNGTLAQFQSTFPDILPCTIKELVCIDIKINNPSSSWRT